jgi:hypothetical protein
MYCNFVVIDGVIKNQRYSPCSQFGFPTVEGQHVETLCCGWPRTGTPDPEIHLHSPRSSDALTKDIITNLFIDRGAYSSFVFVWNVMTFPVQEALNINCKQFYFRFLRHSWVLFRQRCEWVFIWRTFINIDDVSYIWGSLKAMSHSPVLCTDAMCALTHYFWTPERLTSCET